MYASTQNKREWLHVLDHCSAIDLVLREGREG
jgi:dTDP-glucose 4,6-dehydratase